MTVTPEAMQQAQRALKVFRGLQPVLTTYARILTGRPDVRVIASTTSNGSTDGTKIFYRPPLALGRNAEHEKWNCNKRGEYGIQLCPACADHEQILSTVYHEIAHIWKESFAETSDYDRRKVIDHAIAEYGTKYADEIRRRIEAAPYSARSTYSGLAALVSPFLKMVVNALEDARINQELFRAHPGAITIFAAKTNRIFAQGVEQLDHETGEFEHKSWKDYPLNSQVVCGLLCMACGYDYSNWFHPSVVAALNDEKLQELVKKTGLLGSMSEVYAQAFPVLARLRELGFCRLEQDPEDEEEPPPEPEPEQEQPEPPESDEQPEQGDPGDDDPGEGEPQEQDGQGSGDDSEEPGEQSEPGSGEPDEQEGNEAADAGDGDDSASSGPGEDQQGSDDSPGGDESGETGDDSGANEASPESGNGEPGESGEAGDVGDEDSHEAQGSAGTGSEAEGPAGGEGGDQELGSGGSGDEPDQSRGSDSGGGEGLAEDVRDPGEAGPGDFEVPPGDDPGLGGSAVGDPSGDGADAHSPGDADDDLGGSSGLDGTDGEPSGAEPDGDPGVDAEAGGSPDGSDAGGQDEADPEADVAPVDTGPFSHGTTVNVDENAPEPESTPEMGTPEEAEAGLTLVLDHEPPHEIESDGSVIDEETAMKTALVQGAYFETPSAVINEIHEFEFPEELYDRMPHQCPGITEGNGKAWTQLGMDFGKNERVVRGIDGDWSVPEAVIAKSLLKARIVFSENLRGKTQANLKSGKVSSRHLGKRAPVDDPRMMRKRVLPKKRDYFVLIGIDVSDSTRGSNLVLAKRLAMAEAELLKRLNVKFAVVAHSGKFVRSLEKIDIHYYWIKKPDEMWDTRVKARLEKLGADTINLDGHSLEFYRKILDRRKETDRIIHYYTDGAMPAANFAEELEVLQREIKVCRQKGYVLRGIGIRTDSPKQHGLETIELHEQEDILLVIQDLEKLLMGR